MQSEQIIQSLNGRKVILGVTGSIAAYKAASIARHLVRSGAETHVVLTSAGERFITRHTFAALTGHRVHTEIFEHEPCTSLETVQVGLCHYVQYSSSVYLSHLAGSPKVIAPDYYITEVPLLARMYDWIHSISHSLV